MDYTKATKQQLKNILEWDENIPAPLLPGVYEEAVRRDIFKAYLSGIIFRVFGTSENAEKSTRMTMDELRWAMYEKGFETVKAFKPGDKPFVRVWAFFSKRLLIGIFREQNAQKRTAEIIDIDSVGEWVLPSSWRNTEKAALDRIYVKTLIGHMTETEKEIFLKRAEGYTQKEIGQIQGISRTGVQKKINFFIDKVKRMGIV